ncbi:hypothetical protein Q1695_013455 [Nippostrongylus brasiliensis]|nr:hypothetical protein Q1695_013455 [Nippostrongylus brasiliensis]
MAPTAVTVVSNREEDSMNNEPSLSGRTIIGLIYPPPDIRTIVDKTAAFVARNGVDFENKIREKEANNKRFNFLSPTDPYNAYYKQKVRDFQEGKADTAVAPPKPQLPEAVKDAVKKADFVPTKPPPAFEFCADPATINAYDLDLIRMTALFVSRNGRQFLTQLMTREARNFQFDFLKPQHSNFSYFTKLVEQYTKVIIPPNTILEDLRAEKENTKKLMEDVNYRVSWEKHQKSLRDKEEKEAEKERVAYASIDWHDFVVVQTVDFQPGDTTNLPGLCTPKDVGARILLEARSDAQKQTAEAMEMDMEESDSEEETEQPIEQEVPEAEPQPTPAQEEAPPPPTEFATPLPPTRQKDLIVKDYDPKKAAHALKRPTDKWLISPLTGERIPSDKLEEHVRYNTVDSQYKEDRERQLGERGNEEPVLAPGAEISKNLGRFAERRTDIFGVGAAGAEQTVIGRKLGEEEPQPTKQLIWDGSEETREAHTLAVQSQVTIDQQIHEIHRQHGFLPDSSKERIGAQPPQMPPRPAAAANPAPAVPRMYPPATGAAGLISLPPGYPVSIPTSVPSMQPPPPAAPEGPPAKRQRNEDELEPEAEWLNKVSGTIDLRIQLPTNAEFNMDGSIIGLQIDVKSTVGDLKQNLQDKLSMPTGKQKLIFDGFFLKDNFSLAYYNMKNQSFVILQVKERGGKNK